MRNTGKRIIGFMAAMLLAFGLIPGGVLGAIASTDNNSLRIVADGSSFPCISNGTRDEGVINSITSYGVESVTYDKSLNSPTITLNNVNSKVYAIMATGFDSLNIILERNNMISGNAPRLIYSDSTINISGNGTLTIDCQSSGTTGIKSESANGSVNISGGAEVTINLKSTYGTGIDASQEIIISGSSSLTINGGDVGITTNKRSIRIIENSSVSITNANYGITNARMLNIDGSNVIINSNDTAIGQNITDVDLRNKATLEATGSNYGINLADGYVTINDDSTLKAKATGEGGKAISGPIDSNKDGAGWETPDDSGKPEKIAAGKSSASALEKYKYIEIPREITPEPTPEPEKTPEPEAPKSEPEKPASSAKHDDDEERDLNLPKTGDAAENGIWIAMILTGVAMMAGLAITRKRTGRKTGRE